MAEWWKHISWRMIQTNLRETDMQDIDADVYVQELQKFDANVVLLNTGGIIASYPTEIEDHFQSRHLHGDSLEKIMKACHAAGIRVIARMDFSKIREPIYQKHPDWAYRTQAGKIVNYNGDVHACICGEYQQKKAFEIIEEVVRKLPVDGLFINMGGFQVRDYSYNHYGICHCESCRRRFMERFGCDLPNTESLDDPVYRHYKVFQQEVLNEHKARLVKTIRNMNPDIAIDGVDYTRMESNTEYKRPLPFWQYSASSNTRALRGIHGKMVSSNTSVDFIGFFYRHVSVNPEEQALRLWQDIANFGGVDYYVIGRLDNHEDKSGYENIRRAFHYAKVHEDEYKGLISIADALLIRGYRWDAIPEERGWIRALTEAHILFDEVHLNDIHEDDDLLKYKLIILPGTPSVSRWLARKLDLFANAGGTVLATAGTGQYDDEYQPAETFPLRCMGIDHTRFIRNDMVSAMLHVEGSDLPVFSSFNNDRLIYLGDTFLYIDNNSDLRKFLKLIPPHPYGPPERCQYTQITDIPGVLINRYGKGKGIMIPWCPGTLYYRDGYANTFRFIRDLLLNEVKLITVEEDPAFTPMVEVTAAKARDDTRILIQLVNNSGHFGTSYFPPIPVKNIHLKVPCGCEPASVTSQTTGTSIPYQWKEGIIHLSVSVDSYFEGIIIHLTKKQASTNISFGSS